MYKTPLFLLFALSFLSCIAQSEESLNGQWYLINKSGFVKWTISADSLSYRHLFPNFLPKRSKGRSYAIGKKVSLQERVLLLAKNPSRDSQEYYTLVTLVPQEDGQSMQYIWNAIDTSATIESILKFNKEDRRKLLGFTLYSKERIAAFKEKRSLEEMSQNDFKTFRKTLDQNLMRNSSEVNRSLLGFGAASSYKFQMVIATLLELGYNPIQDSDSINALFAKYEETQNND